VNESFTGWFQACILGRHEKRKPEIDYEADGGPGDRRL
jgi:hypothetical protein